MKDIFKSGGAVLAGLIFIGVTHTGTDAILERLGILPPDNLWVGPGLILLVLGYRALWSIAGCYIAAWLAPRAPVRHALALGAIGTVLSTGGAIANQQMHLGPAWYAWALVAMALPLSWIGGRLYVARR